MRSTLTGNGSGEGELRELPFSSLLLGAGETFPGKWGNLEPPSSWESARHTAAASPPCFLPSCARHRGRVRSSPTAPTPAPAATAAVLPRGAPQRGLGLSSAARREPPGLGTKRRAGPGPPLPARWRPRPAVAAVPRRARRLRPAAGASRRHLRG